jgi:hypothetical protein
MQINRINVIYSIMTAFLFTDIANGFLMGVNSESKAWIEHSVLITISTFYSIYLVIAVAEEKYLKLLYQSLIGLAVMIFLTSLYEHFYLKMQAGRIITGYQNISSAILLLSLPLLEKFQKIDWKIKLIFHVLVMLTVILLLKSRLAAIIGILYSVYYILNLNKNKIYYIVVILFLLLLVSFGFIKLPERFSSLIYGNDVWFRVYIWERLIYGGLENFIFGSGFGKISELTSAWQHINPAVELLSGYDTFKSAHNDYIEKFIYGGIFSVFIGFVINLFIIIGYIKKKKFELKIELIIYIILLMHALIDIHNSYIHSLILFNFFQFYLIYKIYERPNN